MVDGFSAVVEASYKQDEYARRAARERSDRALRSAYQLSQPVCSAVPPSSDVAARSVLALRPRFPHWRVIDVLLGRAAA